MGNRCSDHDDVAIKVITRFGGPELRAAKDWVEAPAFMAGGNRLTPCHPDDSEGVARLRRMEGPRVRSLPMQIEGILP